MQNIYALGVINNDVILLVAILSGKNCTIWGRRLMNLKDGKELLCGGLCTEVLKSSKHFISGRKSNDPASPDYVPTVLNHVKSPQKRRLMNNMTRYERMLRNKRRRVDK